MSNIYIHREFSRVKIGRKFFINPLKFSLFIIYIPRSTTLNNSHINPETKGSSHDRNMHHTREKRKKRKME